DLINKAEIYRILPNKVLSITKPVFYEGISKIKKTFSPGNKYISETIERTKEAIIKGSSKSFASDSDVKKFFEYIEDDDSDLLLTRYKKQEHTRNFIENFTNEFAKTFLEISLATLKTIKIIAIYRGKYDKSEIEEINTRINKCLNTSKLISEEFFKTLIRKGYHTNVTDKNFEQFKFKLISSFRETKGEYWEIDQRIQPLTKQFISTTHALSTSVRYNAFPNNLFIRAIDHKSNFENKNEILDSIYTFIQNHLDLDKSNSSRNTPENFDDLKQDQTYYQISEFYQDNTPTLIVHGAGSLSHRNLIELSKSIFLKKGTAHTLQVELYTSLMNHIFPTHGEKSKEIKSDTLILAYSEMRREKTYKKILEKSFFSEIRQTSFNSNISLPIIDKHITTKIKGKCTPKNKELPGASQLYYNTTFYTDKKDPPMKVDILVLTFIDNEYEGVRKKLSNFTSIKPSEYSSFISGVGYVSTSFGELSIGLAMTLDSGQVSIAASTNSILSHFNFNLVTMVGCAGCVDKSNYNIGDVVIPNKAIALQERKKDRWSNNSFKISNRYQSFIRSALLNKGKVIRKEKEEIKLSHTPIISSPIVISEDEGKHISIARDIDYKAVIVEMEAYGFNEAIEATKEFNDIEYLIFRGISDFADEQEKWALLIKS
ncbi:hypothetical protein C3B51_23260, partial [Pseudoalteromonas rubra]